MFMPLENCVLISVRRSSPVTPGSMLRRPACCFEFGALLLLVAGELHVLVVHVVCVDLGAFV